MKDRFLLDSDRRADRGDNRVVALLCDRLAQEACTDTIGELKVPDLLVLVWPHLLHLGVLLLYLFCFNAVQAVLLLFGRHQVDLIMSSGDGRNVDQIVELNVALITMFLSQVQLLVRCGCDVDVSRELFVLTCRI